VASSFPNRAERKNAQWNAVRKAAYEKASLDFAQHVIAVTMEGSELINTQLEINGWRIFYVGLDWWTHQRIVSSRVCCLRLCKDLTLTVC